VGEAWFSLNWNLVLFDVVVVKVPRWRRYAHLVNFVRFLPLFGSFFFRILSSRVASLAVGAASRASKAPTTSSRWRFWTISHLQLSGNRCQDLYFFRLSLRHVLSANGKSKGYKNRTGTKFVFGDRTASAEPPNTDFLRCIT
jgi:hypothetical protein